MDGALLVRELNDGPQMEPEENVFSSIWAEYERVIIESLVTSFGLDFMVKDQYGGDVDTIHNVRKIGPDSKMEYKNAANKSAYDNRGAYDDHKYHGNNPSYRKIVREAKKNGKEIPDTYVPGNKVIPYKNKSIPTKRQAQLDHVISGYEIHEDRGRVLSGLNGVDLANDPDNLRFTNAALNNNMKKKSVKEYIEWCEKHPDRVDYQGKKGEPLPEEVKKRLLEEDARARKAYNAKLAQKYYTSPQFAQDTATAAAMRGGEMGLRQALGFVFMELWICAKEEVQAVDAGKDLNDILNAIGNGIKKGLESAKKKYKTIISKIKEGFVSGALASLTTTICNIFFTTAKNLVRCIRQIYASVVQAGKILLFNPENLGFGDRIKAATVILATGASVLVGTIVGEMISKTPIGMAPIVGNIVTTFCSTFVSGLLSCSLLIFLDRSKFINFIIDKLNAFSSSTDYYKKIADAMESIAAKLADLDIDKFREDTQKYSFTAYEISRCEDSDELNRILLTAYEELNIKIPWEGDFDSFMGNRNNKLVFE